MKLSKKKTAIIGAMAACVFGISAAMLIAPASAQQVQPRTREYPASVGTITVGIDASGSITSNKKRQMVDARVKLDEYTVKKGEYIKSGDIVARLLKSDIEEKIKAAQEEVKTAQAELKRAKSDKESFIAEADQRLAQTRGSAASSHNEKAGALNAKASKLSEQINQKLAQIAKLEADIAAYEAEKATPVQGAPDYDSLIKAARDEISRIKAEKELLDAEVAAVNAQLGIANEEYSRLQGNENNNLEGQRVQNIDKLSQHDTTINNLTAKSNEAAEKLKKLKDLLAAPEIKAEHEGVVLGLGFAAGAEIDTSAALIETGAPEDMYIDLLIDAVDFADVEAGQEVSFYVDAYPDATFSGAVKSKSFIQNENGKFSITVKINASEQELYNGMGVSATLIVKQKKDVITLQNKAIIAEGGKQYVNIKTKDGTEKREVKTGFSDGRVSEILSGIQAGEIAIIEEHYENS